MDEFLTILGVVIVYFVLCVILAIVTMWCWNYIMPVLFKLPTITWFQAFVLNILSSILFKSTSAKSGS